MLPRHGLGRIPFCEIEQRRRALQQAGFRRVPSELLEALSFASGQGDEHSTSRGMPDGASLRAQLSEVSAPKGYLSVPPVPRLRRDKLFLFPRTVVVKK